MTRITNFKVLVGGKKVNADAFGNNVAFLCPKCKYPMLAIARKNQRGSDRDHPTACRNVVCGKKYFMEINEKKEEIHIRPLGQKK